MAEAEAGPEWWRDVYNFAIHMMVGVTIFLMVAGAAVVIHLGVKLCGRLEVPNPMILGLIVGEYAVFALDLILFLVFTGRTFYLTLRRML